MSDTAIIIQLRETINRTENMVPFMRLDMLDLLVSVQSEIKTLTEKNAQLRKERDDAQVDQRLIEELWGRRTDMTEMKEQIKLLRSERDEARREICELSSRDSGELDLYASNKEAKKRGWDCCEQKETP